MTTPYDTELEQQVLSCMFSHEDLDDAESLSEDNFFTAAHKLIYRTIKDIPRPIDPIVIAQKLTRNSTIADVGGATYLLDVTRKAQGAWHFKTHVKKLHEMTARRYAINAAQKLIMSASDLSDDESFLFDAAQPMSEVSEIASATSNDRTKEDVLRDITERLTDNFKNKDASMGMKTRIGEIDRLFLGLHHRQISVISGFPTGGKTLLGVQILWNISRQTIPSLMLTLEMTDTDIAWRNLAIATDLPAQAFSRPFDYAVRMGNDKPDDEQKELTLKAVTRLKQSPIQWVFDVSRDLDSICAKIRRYVKREGIQIVAIDYIQLIRGGRHSSKEQEVAHISHAFQGLSKELNIHIILLSQQNADGDTKYAKAIEEDADLILSISQNNDKTSDEFKKHLGIIVKKDRHHGHTGSVLPLILDKENLVFKPEPNYPK